MKSAFSKSVLVLAATFAVAMTGQAVAKFRDSNGEEVTYSVSNKNSLANYIVQPGKPIATPVPAK